MTKVKKETVKAAKTKADATGKMTKTECLEAINTITESLKQFRAEVEADENPAISMIVIRCNENTGGVNSSVIGKGQDLITTLASEMDNDEDVKRIFSLALMLAD